METYYARIKWHVNTTYEPNESWEYSLHNSVTKVFKTRHIHWYMASFLNNYLPFSQKSPLVPAIQEHTNSASPLFTYI